MVTFKPPWSTSPVKPERLPFDWKSSEVRAVEVEVSVPLPDNIPPLIVMRPVTVGLFPRGRLQLLLTVFVPVLLKVTKLKVTFSQLNVALPESKVIVPPLALKVGEPEIVKFPLISKFPLGAVKVPPLIVKADPPCSDVPEGSDIDPEDILTLLVTNEE